MNKINLFNAYLCADNYKYDVLCVTEHWLSNKQFANSSLMIGDYIVADVFVRSVCKGGGAMILVKNNVDFKKNTKINSYAKEKICEISSVYLKKFNLNCVCVYRPPDANFDSFIEILETVLNETLGKQFIICGDFNVKFNTFEGNAVALCDIFKSYGFTQTITENTRGQNCLDNIFLNLNLHDFETDVVDLCLSDHLAQVFHCLLRQPDCTLPEKKIVLYRPITYEGTLKFFNIFSDLSWNFIDDDKLNFREKFAKFHSSLIISYNEAFPERSFSSDCSGNNGSNGWFTMELAGMRNHLHMLNDFYRRYGSDDFKQALNVYRKKYHDAITAARVKNNDSFILNSSNKSKAVWKVINSHRPTSRKYKDCAISAEEFNEYFYNVAPNIVESLPKHETNNASEPRNVEYTFSLGSVTFNDVRAVIDSLKSSDTRDYYGLSTNLIRTVKNIIIYPLTKLINQSIDTMYFPDELKIASVTPIYKKGCTSDPSSYRPISILPTISKIIEKLLKNKILSFFERNCLFCPQQFGFRPGKCTGDAICDFIEFVSDCFEKGDYAAAVFCDVSRAFDCVNHELLLEKLKTYNFDAGSVNYIASYLTGRHQVVRFNGRTSTQLPMRYGVPQGSVLGPLLFLIYVNDLADGLGVEKCILFADDTTLLTRSDVYAGAIDAAKAAEKDAEAWFGSNGLMMNKEKTNILVLAMRDIVEQSNITSVKFLGMMLDTRMQWNVHGDYTAKKLSSAVYMLRSLTNYVSHNVLRVVYFSYFHTIMSYGILLWGHSTSRHRIFGLQRKAIRLMAGLGYRSDCRAAFINLRILTFTCQYILVCLLHIKKNEYEYRKNSYFHSYSTRHNDDFCIDYFRISRSRVGTNYYCVLFYNALPSHIRELSADVFHRKIKSLLIEKAFYTFDEFMNYSKNIRCYL